MLLPVHIKLAENAKPVFLESFLKTNPKLIEDTDGCGNTLLMLAAHKGNERVCQLLIERGANISCVNDDGKTALDLAEESKKTTQTLKALLSQKTVLTVSPRLYARDPKKLTAYMRAKLIECAKTGDPFLLKTVFVPVLKAIDEYADPAVKAALPDWLKAAGFGIDSDGAMVCLGRLETLLSERPDFECELGALGDIMKFQSGQNKRPPARMEKVFPSTHPVSDERLVAEYVESLGGFIRIMKYECEKELGQGIKPALLNAVVENLSRKIPKMHADLRRRVVLGTTLYLQNNPFTPAVPVMKPDPVFGDLGGTMPPINIDLVPITDQVVRSNDDSAKRQMADLFSKIAGTHAAFGDSLF